MSKTSHYLRICRVLTVLLLSLLPAAFVTADPAGDSACRPLPGSNQRLCVNSAPGQKPQWSLVPGDRLAIPMSGSRLYDFSISPNGRRLALITADEGHPVFDLIDLGPAPGNSRIRKTASIDPYPGSLWFGEWDGDRLTLGSSVPLERNASRQPTSEAFEYHYRLDATNGKLLDRTVSVIAPELIVFPSYYDAEQQQWHCDCALTEEGRKHANDNLSWLHLALPTGRTLILDMAVSHTLANESVANDCILALRAAINLPANASIETRYRQETLPEGVGIQIEMRVLSQPTPL